MSAIENLLSQSLPGTWELLSRVDVTANGDQRVEPVLGAEPVAMLFYDRSGHFAAQFMKRDRSNAVAASVTVYDPGSSHSNNSRPIGGYDAYFGDYEVDDRSNLVKQTLRGALSVESVGLVVERTMVVDGDRLTISLLTTSGAESVTRTLTWKRIG